MRLESFRITNFRSVSDSGWVNVSQITSILGRNESGKSNLLRGLPPVVPVLLAGGQTEGDRQQCSDIFAVTDGGAIPQRNRRPRWQAVQGALLVTQVAQG